VTAPTAPLAHRTPVLVHDRHGDYAATVLHAGLWPTSPVEVAVVDPLERRDLTRGQHLVVPRGQVVSLHRSRWSR